ncbi:(2,3-dihydroxybenzoyl)adenylate synthase [Paracoccus fistulariae]|uniref:(2,3-dihydroxybenzoyl)adenylate synthase n=1 Tax=Paracoccus fistulariae TaxID=658446 RepID=A0ABY7SIL8_9RHOB|nr:(2,3-dihydroxybenzoyl)adenylate synthase [Paracoccus fistulariae]MDB6181839.1 (2,3-dihydroxybenzoyl)adenylate synthase [Paracoccus fistulariae]WCR05872.1 (2,3-dihydroxybenzoyl)adenylate synthase [Paracoccus fistulariae]
MLIDFCRFPADLAARYRARGYWIDEPLTRALDESTRATPEAIAVIDGDRQLSYRELSDAVANLADRLRRDGLGRGDTAVVQLPNCAEFIITFHALLRAGIVPVNAIYSHRQLEMGNYIQQLKPALLIGDHAHELFATGDFLDGLTTRGQAPRRVILKDSPDADTALSAWLAGTGQARLPADPTPPDEVAFFQLSGGSTGTPKLIPRTHNDYDYSIRASAEICGLDRQTRFLCALPAAHNFTMSSPGILGVLHAGGCIVMAPSPDPAACFRLIAEHRVTVAALVPSAVQLWQRHAALAGPPAPLRHLLVGGASFTPEIARAVPDVLNCQLQQVFGMAEGLVNYTRLDDDPETVMSMQGRPISPDDDIRLLDETGRPVPDGQPGALSVRGPYTFRGYFKSPEHNSQAFDKDGFYHSGDVVIRRPDGYLRVVGRIKDQINRGGEKVAAEEIEALLMRHPLIRQAALVAMPDAMLGERSVAVIVSNGSVKSSTLRRHLRDLGLADYKLPDRFHQTDSLPLTHIGKTDKRRLREMLQAADARQGVPA